MHSCKPPDPLGPNLVTCPQPSAITVTNPRRCTASGHCLNLVRLHASEDVRGDRPYSRAMLNSCHTRLQTNCTFKLLPHHIQLIRPLKTQNLCRYSNHPQVINQDYQNEVLHRHMWMHAISTQSNRDYSPPILSVAAAPPHGQPPGGESGASQIVRVRMTHPLWVRL